MGLPRKCPEAKFIVTGCGDKVDYGIRLSYRPIVLHRLAGTTILSHSRLYPPIRDEFGYCSIYAFRKNKAKVHEIFLGHQTRGTTCLLSSLIISKPGRNRWTSTCIIREEMKECIYQTPNMYCR
jgi:hypothetical protein